MSDGSRDYLPFGPSLQPVEGEILLPLNVAPLNFHGDGVVVEVAEGAYVTVGIETRGGRTNVSVKPRDPSDEGESGYRDLT